MEEFLVTSLQMPSDHQHLLSDVHLRVLQQKRDDWQQSLLTRQQEYTKQMQRLAHRYQVEEVPGSVANRAKLRQAFDKRQEDLIQYQQLYQERLHEIGARYSSADNSRIASGLTTPPSTPSSRLGSSSAYLAKVLQPYLQQALASICFIRPQDPIETLAFLLKHHYNQEERRKQMAVDHLRLQLEKEEASLRMHHQLLIKSEQRFIRMEHERRKHIFLRRSSEAQMDVAKEGTDSSRDFIRQVKEHAQTDSMPLLEDRLIAEGHESDLYTIEEGQEST